MMVEVQILVSLLALWLQALQGLQRLQQDFIKFTKEGKNKKQSNYQELYLGAISKNFLDLTPTLSSSGNTHPPQAPTQNEINTRASLHHPMTLCHVAHDHPSHAPKPLLLEMHHRRVAPPIVRLRQLVPLV